MIDRFLTYFSNKYCSEPMIRRLIRQRDNARTAGDLLARHVHSVGLSRFDKCLKSYSDSDGIAFAPKKRSKH